MSSRFDLLREEGIDVIPVSQVGDVLPILRKFENSVGLVVLDIVMPPGDFYSLAETDGGLTTGLRLLKDIRDEYEFLPIVVVSIRRRNFADQVLAQYKVTAYLEKPCTTADLFNIIRTFL